MGLPWDPWDSLSSDTPRHIWDGVAGRRILASLDTDPGVTHTNWILLGWTLICNDKMICVRDASSWPNAMELAPNYGKKDSQI